MKYSDTYLSTSLAHVRLFACMDAGMNGQSRALNELFTTSWPITSVWSNTRVYPFYALSVK